MGLYDRYLLPKLIALAMRQERLTPYRKRTVRPALGRVLEIGAGAGANLPFYATGVSEVLGLEPHPRLSQMAAAAGLRTIAGSAEDIPLKDHSVDSVVMTWTLCSIPDPGKALREMRRVLKPDGRLLFVEHGLAPDASVRAWQRGLTPIWKHAAGGCHLDRDIPALVQAAGFTLEQLETGYMAGPRPVTFMYEGSARPTGWWGGAGPLPGAGLPPM